MDPKTPKPFAYTLAHVLAIGSFLYSVTFVWTAYLLTEACHSAGPLCGFGLGGIISSVAAICVIGLAHSLPEFTGIRRALLIILALCALALSIMLPLSGAMCVIY